MFNMVVAGQKYTTCDYAKKVTKSGAVFFQSNAYFAKEKKNNIYIVLHTINIFKSVVLLFIVVLQTYSMALEEVSWTTVMVLFNFILCFNAHPYQQEFCFCKRER